MTDWSPKVAAAYVKAFAEVSAVTKAHKANVGTYNYDYADLTDVLNTVRPVLAKHGLAVAQSVQTNDRMIDVFTTLVHESGESVTFGPLGLPAGGTPQQAGSAVTYARRYAVLAALGLATEDDDGQKAAQPAPQDEYVPTAGQMLMGTLPALSAEKKAELRALANENNKKLTASAFDADPVWLELVEATINEGATQ